MDPRHQQRREEKEYMNQRFVLWTRKVQMADRIEREKERRAEVRSRAYYGGRKHYFE